MIAKAPGTFGMELFGPGLHPIIEGPILTPALLLRLSYPLSVLQYIGNRSKWSPFSDDARPVHPLPNPPFPSLLGGNPPLIG